MPIQSFAQPELRAFLVEGRAPKWLPADLRRTAHTRLVALHAAEVLHDLMRPPGNRLEALKGDRKGFHSIRVNQQWRIVFRWTPTGPAEVEIVDYH